MESRATAERPVLACYREFAPASALAGLVRALFSFTADAEPVAPGRRVLLEMTVARGDSYSRSFADGNASVVFELGSAFHLDGVWRPNAGVPGGHALGPMRRASPGIRNSLSGMVGAFLLPTHAATFLHVPSAELTDTVVALGDLWGPAALDLAGRMSVASESQRLDLLEAALLERVAPPCDGWSAIDVRGVAGAIARSGGTVSVAALARSAGVSRQHLTRVFRERVGVTPKMYCRLARFQSALVHARRDDVEWARLAGALGYADQSHMIADFRQFSGMTPRAIASGRWRHPFVERSAPAMRG